MNAATFLDQQDASVLNGAERVAALLLSMGRTLAGRLLKHFDEEELRDVTRAAAHLGAVPRANLETLVDEFAQQFTSGLDIHGSVGEAEQLLAEALPPEKAANIMSYVFGNPNAGLWEKLAALPETRVASYLSQEHSQVSAYILTQVDSTQTAAILSKMPRAKRNEIIKRMISMRPVTEEVGRLLETALDASLLNVPAGDDAQSCARVADIVNKLEPADVEDIMQSISQTSPKDAAQLKRLLFSFDDLLKLSVRARSTLFDAISTDIVVMALRGTNPEFRDAVLSAMASRARRLVESELANSGPVAQRDIAKARRTIVDMVLRMAQRNEIEIASPDDAQAT